MKSSQGNQDHSCRYNYEVQERDQDRSGNNTSGNFFNGSSSHVHLQTSCSNGGVLELHESSNNHEFLPNGINLNPQAGGPLGLKLKKSPSIIKKLQLLLTKEKQREKHQEQPAFDQSEVQKLKATNIPAVFLNIGSWKWVSKNKEDLVAKFYYGRKKLVWEFLYGALKKKIEIPWSQISAINMFVAEDKNRVLQIELNEQPICGQEIRFRAGKHTIWGPSPDFTLGEASVCRRHSVVFLPGVLDEAFRKLLQCDSQLFNISRQPFPADNSPFFCNQILDFSNNRSIVHRSSLNSNYGHQGTFLPPVQNLVQPTTSFVHHSNSNLPMPGLIFPNSIEDSMGVPFQQQRTDGVGNGQVQDGDHQYHIVPNHGEESWFLDQELEWHLTDIQNLVEFTNNLSWIPDLQHELHLTDIYNTRNSFEVESTCKPFKENHWSDFKTCGNVDDLDGTQVNGEVAFKEHNSWKPKETGIDDSSNVINDMGYLDDNLCNVDHESGLNNIFTFMEPSSWPTSQFTDQDFNKYGNGMKNLHSFDPSGGGKW